MSNYFNRSRNNTRISRNPVSVNYSRRATIDLYTNMYNNTLRQIDALYDNLNEIKHNIDCLVGLEDDYIPNLRESNRDINNHSRVQVNDEINNPIVSNNYNSSSSNSDENSPPNTNYQRSANNLMNTTNDINTNMNDIWSLLNSYSSLPSVSNTDVISQTTRLITFSEIENPMNDRCPISHEVFLDEDQVRQIIPCGHIFNNNEINTWLERNLHCPVCRCDIMSSLTTSDVSGNTVSDPSNNLLPTTYNRINNLRYDMRYDLSGNYVLLETFYRVI